MRGTGGASKPTPLGARRWCPSCGEMRPHASLLVCAHCWGLYRCCGLCVCVFVKLGKVVTISGLLVRVLPCRVRLTMECNKQQCHTAGSACCQPVHTACTVACQSFITSITAGYELQKRPFPSRTESTLASTTWLWCAQHARGAASNAATSSQTHSPVSSCPSSRP
jgi:hypothetical protein